MEAGVGTAGLQKRYFSLKDKAGIANISGSTGVYDPRYES